MVSTTSPDKNKYLEKLNFPRHLISANDLNSDHIHSLFDRANWIMSQPVQNLKKLGENLILANLFYQSSTRTRLGFEVSMLRLGGSVTGFADVGSTRAGDFFQESLEDTIRVVSNYADLLVIRHPENFSALHASKSSNKPVINAGDGNNEHPTQALLDSWILINLLKQLENKTIGLVGNPEFRVLRSMIIVLRKLKIKHLIFMPPPGIEFPTQLKTELDKDGIKWQVVNNVQTLLDQADGICMVSLVMPDCNESKADPPKKEVMNLPGQYILTPEKILKKGKKCPFILHAGPRGPELPGKIHEFPCIKYYLQSYYGVYLRAAIISQMT